MGGFLSLVPTFLLYALAYGIWKEASRSDRLATMAQHLFITGPVEETAKFLVFFFLSRRLRSLREPLDGLLQAAAVALAFATFENLQYTMAYGLSVLPLRAVVCTGGHIFYAALWGYFYACIAYPAAGRKIKRAWPPILASLASAALLHGLYNILVTGPFWPSGLLVDGVALALAILFYKRFRGFSPYQPVRGGSPAAALKRTVLALRWDPKNVPLQHRAALLKLHQGDYEEALTHLRVCLRSLPAHPYYLCLRGLVRAASGQPQKGASDVECGWPRLPRTQRRTLLNNALATLGAANRMTLLPEISCFRYPNTAELLGRIAEARKSRPGLQQTSVRQPTGHSSSPRPPSRSIDLELC